MTGDLIDHGIQHQFGMLITVLYALHHLSYVVGAQVGGESTVSIDLPQHLLLRVLTTIAELHQLCGGQ